MIDLLIIVGLFTLGLGLLANSTRPASADDIGAAEWVWAYVLFILHSGTRIDYHEHLQSPKWRKVRIVALKRAKYRCQVCSSSLVLHAHHRTYDRFGHEEICVADITIFCGPLEDYYSCHAIFEREGKLRSGGKLRR